MRTLMIITLSCWGLALPACDSNIAGSTGGTSDGYVPSGPTDDSQSIPNDSQTLPPGVEKIPNDTQGAPNDAQHTPWNSPGYRDSVTVVVNSAGGTGSTSTQHTGGSSSTSTQHTGGASSTSTQSSCNTADMCTGCAENSCELCRCAATYEGYPTSICDGVYC